jgi:DNA polymerase-3 subunit epsilon
MKKVLFFDCETTGLDPVKNDIIQLAGIIEIDGKEVEEFDFKCQPFSYDNISLDALAKNEISLDDIKCFAMPLKTQRAFVEILGKYCDKFDKNDKFYPAGFEVGFDINFLSQWFEKCGDKYIGSWIDRRRPLDPRYLLSIMDYQGKISLPDYKLKTVSDHFSIVIKAHDALSDIRATKLIFKRVMEELKI